MMSRVGASGGNVDSRWLMIYVMVDEEGGVDDGGGHGDEGDDGDYD